MRRRTWWWRHDPPCAELRRGTPRHLYRAIRACSVLMNNQNSGFLPPFHYRGPNDIIRMHTFQTAFGALSRVSGAFVLPTQTFMPKVLLHVPHGHYCAGVTGRRFCRSWSRSRSRWVLGTPSRCQLRRTSTASFPRRTTSLQRFVISECEDCALPR